ncbi:MAG: hypothetical protein P4N59_08180 [Negativicutes bacterium]|uniref:hypothetical protein n=1 Tax=Pseudomonas sp. MWU13-2100 TaxID=2935075 RepID=UPI00200E59C8|nr:hypothetical protein [Pseudomonas sp. MWU13-2100]MDR3561401.1 hypothetical protein [Negativicutes bacterium]
MNVQVSRKVPPLLCLLILAIGFSMIAGCSGRGSHTPEGGYACYAKAVPSQGDGGLAWGPNVKNASVKAMGNCQRYAAESGGTPATCKVTLTGCR